MQREHVEASKAQMKDNALDKRYRLSHGPRPRKERRSYESGHCTWRGDSRL